VGGEGADDPSPGRCHFRARGKLCFLAQRFLTEVPAIAWMTRWGRELSWLSSPHPNPPREGEGVWPVGGGARPQATACLLDLNAPHSRQPFERSSHSLLAQIALLERFAAGRCEASSACLPCRSRASRHHVQHGGRNAGFGDWVGWTRACAGLEDR